MRHSYSLSCCFIFLLQILAVFVLRSLLKFRINTYCKSIILQLTYGIFSLSILGIRLFNRKMRWEKPLTFVFKLAHWLTLDAKGQLRLSAELFVCKIVTYRILVSQFCLTLCGLNQLVLGSDLALWVFLFKIKSVSSAEVCKCLGHLELRLGLFRYSSLSNLFIPITLVNVV